MKIPGMKMASPLASDIRRSANTSAFKVDQLTNFRCMADVAVETVYIGHHDYERNYRPYMHFSGELRGLRPDFEEGESNFPVGVTEITFAPSQGDLIDVYYEFTDEQLANMVHKGYFNRGFETPIALRDQNYLFPVETHLLFLHPQTNTDVPTVFVEVANRDNVHIDRELSGYDFEQAFVHTITDVPTKDIPETEVQAEHADLYEGIGFDQETLTADLDDVLARQEAQMAQTDLETEVAQAEQEPIEPEQPVLDDPEVAHDEVVREFDSIFAEQVKRRMGMLSGIAPEATPDHEQESVSPTSGDSVEGREDMSVGTTAGSDHEQVPMVSHMNDDLDLSMSDEPEYTVASALPEPVATADVADEVKEETAPVVVADAEQADDTPQDHEVEEAKQAAERRAEQTRAAVKAQADAVRARVAREAQAEQDAKSTDDVEAEGPSL